MLAATLWPWGRPIFLGVKGGRSVRLTTHRHLWADCLENVGASTSHNPIGFHGLLQGWLYLFFILSDISIQRWITSAVHITLLNNVRNGCKYFVFSLKKAAIMREGPLAGWLQYDSSNRCVISFCSATPHGYTCRAQHTQDAGRIMTVYRYDKGFCSSYIYIYRPIFLASDVIKLITR
jgi:hypothetical protein